MDYNDAPKRRVQVGQGSLGPNRVAENYHLRAAHLDCLDHPAQELGSHKDTLLNTDANIHRLSELTEIPYAILGDAARGENRADTVTVVRELSTEVESKRSNAAVQGIRQGKANLHVRAFAISL
jgi:hypothetical protein